MYLEYKWLLLEHGIKGDAEKLFTLAKDLETQDELRVAAVAYDRAFGLDPGNREIARSRYELLEQLAVVEHGIKFCYIPAGSFLMGSESGDLDEQPVHPVQLDEFWLSETPISWLSFVTLMDWYPLTWRSTKVLGESEIKAIYNSGLPREYTFQRLDPLREENKVRWEYCTTTDIGSTPPPDNPEQEYGQKPMVAISWKRVLELTDRLSTSEILYRLPTEAEWEKAARGGLINCKYPWGDILPTNKLCDFDRFEIYNFQSSILPMKSYPPNHYGLYAMAGGVWEWVNDWYDAFYYKKSPRHNPKGPVNGHEKVLRGGSWADCAEAVTVSFRTSRKMRTEWNPKTGWSPHISPNIGFRLCRLVQKE
jgi:sulfatase modifying factor 1